MLLLFSLLNFYCNDNSNDLFSVRNSFWSNEDNLTLFLINFILFSEELLLS